MRYFNLSKAEKLELNGENLDKAILEEAVERGITIPIKFDNSVLQKGGAYYHLPADHVDFYEILRIGKYNREPSGVAFASLEAAQRALEGAIAIVRESFSSRVSLGNPEFDIQVVSVCLRPEKCFSATIEEFVQDLEPYNALCEEIMTDLREIRQADYDREIRKTKRAEYLRLADGNETIAQGFWAKIEKSEWPTE